MPKDFPRSRRVAEQVKRLVSTIIRLGINDPRVGGVTLSEVEVSRDLAHAKIYVVPMFGTKHPEEVVDALNHASGFIRSELGKQLKARLIPTLNFVYDQSFDKADELSRLINKAIASDAKGHE